ncbi:MAG: UDP-N-acetylmuramate dehydrogenase [Bacilli bacterium]
MNSDYTTFKNFDVSTISPVNCGGVVKNFFVVYTRKGLKDVFKIIKNNKWKCYIIGGCTKILFKDTITYDCFIRYENKEININNDELKCGSGNSLSNIVSLITSMGYKGFEGLIGIPGLIGGAICNNSGAFGNEIQDNVRYVKYMDFDGKVITLTRKKCLFRYRHSIFKDKQLGMIIEVCFKLKKGDPQLIKRKIEQYRNKRLLSQPLNSKTLGCTFKNPPFLSAGRLIDDCELKGLADDGVKVSTIHGNFIEFSKKKSTKNALRIIDIIIDKVYNKTNLELELELLIVG